MNPDGSLPSGTHPSPEQLAHLIDSDAGADHVLVEHLAGCRRCMGIYAEFVQARADQLASSGSPGWRPQVVPVAAPVTLPSRRLGARVPAVAAAGLAAGLLVVVMTLRLESSTTATHRAIGTEMRHDAVGGLIYAPDLPPTPRGIRGSGTGDRTAEALTALTRRYDAGKASADDSFWLIGGFLAANELENADAYLGVALAASPADPRLQNLAAILAYKRNDLAGATTHLERAVALDPTAEALYNLARVKDATGDAAGADALRARLTKTYGKSPIVTWMAEAGD